jgi:hypothetical protein
MHNLMLILIIGFLPMTSCKHSGNESKHSAEGFPLYENRAFELNEKSQNAKIDFSLIENLGPWDQDLLLRLFVPIAGENTVYSYKSEYCIPPNIDETEGVYLEYLIIEVGPNGIIKEALLYEGGPKQGPLFWSLFRASNLDLHLKDFSDISQLNLVCPYETLDRIHKGNAHVAAPPP